MRCPEGVQVCAWCGRGRQAVAVRNRWTASSFFWRGPIRHRCPLAGACGQAHDAIITAQVVYTSNNKRKNLRHCSGPIDADVQTVPRRDRPSLCAIAGRHHHFFGVVPFGIGAHWPGRVDRHTTPSSQPKSCIHQITSAKTFAIALAPLMQMCRISIVVHRG